MTDPNIFIVVATVFFLILGAIWGKDDGLNLLLKISFFCLAAWGLLLTNQIYF